MRLHHGISGIIKNIRRGFLREYPDDFDTATFPAGKQIAVSRAVCIAIMTAFLLIIFACFGVLWVQKSIKNHPFLVSINEITGQWTVVEHNHNNIKGMSTTQTLQESVLGKYIKRRFYLPGATKWQYCDRSTDCVPEKKCNADGNCAPEEITFDNADACALFCITGDTEYKEFMEMVIPQYLVFFNSGESWSIDMSGIQMTPISPISANGGIWQIKFTIISNMASEAVDILAYASIGKNIDAYPQTLGYYVEDFNAYKIN